VRAALSSLKYKATLKEKVMCPLCISTAALAMGTVVSADGMLAFFAKRLPDAIAMSASLLHGTRRALTNC
jgi:hypothetical protein